MFTMKVFHALFAIIWLGNILSLTRLLGYHSKLSPTTQSEMAAIYYRMYHFIGLPSMALALVLGMMLLPTVDLSSHPAWFHTKMAALTLLLVLDFVLGYKVRLLREAPHESRAMFYKLLHGGAGLCALMIFCALFGLKT